MESKDNHKKYDSKQKVDSLIDEIIQKNKYKFTPADNDISGISSNFEKRQNIYFLKKSKKEKKPADVYSEKIINKAKSNLDSKPLKKAEIDKEKVDDSKKNSPKIKKRVRFGKKNTNESDDDKFDIQTTDNIVESEDYDKIVSDIDKEVKKMNKEHWKKNKKQSEKIISTVDEKSNVKLDQSKTDVANFFKDKKPLKKKLAEKDSDIEEEIEKKEETSKNLKNEKEIISNDLIDEKEDLLEDKKIIEEKDKQIKKEKKAKIETDSISPFEKNNLKNKNQAQEDKKTEYNRKIKDDYKNNFEETQLPIFHVDNLPDKKTEDYNIIDKKLKEDDISKEEDKNVDIEKKAYDLAQKHIGDKPSEKEEKENISKENPTDFFESGKNETLGSAQEHVFFDEEADQSTWTPQMSDAERKKFKESKSSFEDDIDLGVKPELDEKDFGEIKDVELPKEVLNINSVKLSDLGFSENEWEELDFYKLFEPYVFVEILREKDTLEKCYFLVEQKINEKEKQTLDFIRDTINYTQIETEEIEKQGKEEYLATRVKEVLDEYKIEIEDKSLSKILYYLYKDSLGLGKIDPILKDPNIEDISCDGAGSPLFLYHRQYGSLKSNVAFDTEEELSSFIHKLAQKCGKHISIADPMIDATMPDGSRIQMTLSDEVTAHGSTFTIRKFRSDPFSPPDLVEFNTMSSEMIAYLWLGVENGINMLFAGGTASGKTTALNALSLFIPPESKIVSIEETREINLPHPNWIPGVARSGFGEVVQDKMVGEIDLYDLMKAALRQRPEYILVGEIRGKEAYVLFQAMATGHATYSTVHADSAHSLIHRLEGKPINIPRVMLQSLDVVSLHVTTRVKNKRARRCKQLIEIIDIDPTTKEILTNEVFRWNPVEDEFQYSGKSYVLERIRAEKDFTRDEITKELKKRTKIIDYMNENNIRDFRRVANLISQYVENPIKTLEEIEKKD